ncbi:MAG: branched-chain amino acid ABC transporter permease [Spirochaetales bacterium]|nr:branched-chain amino acid ABC transporter permease [Spirochaetales bacterium]
MKRKNSVLSFAGVVFCLLLLLLFNKTFDSYKMRIFNLCAIYITLGLSLNLVNGFTGLFSLGHAGFMAVGAYTCALLTLSPANKEMNFFLQPILPFLANTEWPFFPALLVSGLCAAIIGFLIAAPVLRLKDDYLAIATLGFSEIIRVIFTNTQRLTNGALGLKGLPNYTNVWWSWGVAALTIVFMIRLMRGSYGKALKSIREDEIAAEAMGIDVFRHKVISFTISSFFAGIGGALLGHLLGTIDPLMFRFLLTFNILLIVVLGGIGSITGTVIAAIVVTVLMEVLRVLDSSIDFGLFVMKGIPGLRMVIFSALLMAVILFYQRGLMGTNEFSWDSLGKRLRRIKKRGPK